MRVFILSLLVLAIVFFIPGERCTKKVQIPGLLFLIAFSALVVTKEIYCVDYNLKELLILRTGCMESNVSMMAIYIMTLSNAIIFLKHVFWRLRLKH